MEPAIVILAIVIALATVTKFLQRKVIDRKKMLGYQKELKADQKRFRELLKEGDKNSKEIEVLQSEILRKNSEMLSMNMKLSMFTLPGFLIAFWYLGFLYKGQTLTSFFPLPTFNQFNLLNPGSWIPNGLGTATGYYKMYFFYYLIVNIIFAPVEKIYDKLKASRNKS